MLYLYPKDDPQTLLQHFKDEQILERSTSRPDCLSAEFHLPLTAGGPVLVTAHWASPEAYQAWLDDPWRIAAAARLRELVDQDFGASLYTVAHEVSTVK